MPNRSTENAPVFSDLLLVRMTWVVLGVAGLLGSLWLWCCWCGFPAIPWNDIRVAPAVALHHGISVYSTANSGPVTTWTYGPLPILLMWPAGFASSAIGALETAGAIHISLTLLALTLACLFWPAPPTGAAADGRQARFAAALLCVLLVRNQTSGYTVYCADAPGIVFGLLSLLGLAQRRYWAAAAGAAAATACKQTLIGVGLAQFVWLFLAVSPRAAWLQAGRGAVTGIGMAVISVVIFGGPGLWYTMVELPSTFPNAALLQRINDHAGYLLIHVALPAVVMIIWRRHVFDRKSPLLLPAVAFFCTLPLSLAGFLKIGGNVNSLHSFWLWFPPTLAILTSGRFFSRLGRMGSLALAMICAAVASLWLWTARLPVVPNVQAYHEATYLAARLPEKIWFPLHPLVTLYSDGRLYHDLDGLVVRTILKQPISDERFLAHLPRKRQATAMLLPVGWLWSDIAQARLPKGTPVTVFGLWRVDGTLK